MGGEKSIMKILAYGRDPGCSPESAAATGVPRLRTGSHKNEAFLELLLFLFLRTCHRSFFENVFRNKNVPPTVFPAFFRSKKNRPQIAYPPRKNGSSAFSGPKQCQHFPQKMGFPSGGAFKFLPAGILRVSKNAPEENGPELTPSFS